MLTKIITNKNVPNEYIEYDSELNIAVISKDLIEAGMVYLDENYDWHSDKGLTVQDFDNWINERWIAENMDFEVYNEVWVDTVKDILYLDGKEVPLGIRDILKKEIKYANEYIDEQIADSKEYTKNPYAYYGLSESDFY